MRATKRKRNRRTTDIAWRCHPLARTTRTKSRMASVIIHHRVIRASRGLRFTASRQRVPRDMQSWFRSQSLRYWALKRVINFCVFSFIFADVKRSLRSRRSHKNREHQAPTTVRWASKATSGSFRKASPMKTFKKRLRKRSQPIFVIPSNDSTRRSRRSTKTSPR